MYRVVKMASGYFGKEISDDLKNEEEDIHEFITSGEPVILVSDLEDLSSLGIDPDSVSMV